MTLSILKNADKTVCFAAASILLMAAPAAAQDRCPAFPSGPYAGDVSHGQVIKYIEGRLGGDWQGYIAHQQDRLRRLKALGADGKALPVTHNGAKVEISGADLERYIAVTEGRIGVLRCLADKQSSAVQASAADLNDFATAAGGTPVTVMPKKRPTQIAETQLAQAPKAPSQPERVHVELRNAVGSPLDIEVSASCEGDTTIFRIVNKGPEFPDPGSITVYQIGGAEKRTVRTRRVQLRPDQSTTFKIKSYLNPTGQLGLHISPSWYVRSSGLDSVIRCGS